ncbi:hypothetical protein ES706_05197 [subsurface metagenome]
MTNNIEQQVTQQKQQAAQAGFSGSAILDIHPSSGIIRLKVNTIPPEKIGEFIRNYANVITMSLNSVNISVKTHVADEE